MENKGNIFFTTLASLKESVDGAPSALSFDMPAEMATDDLPQWFSENYEGELSVDVYQTGEYIVVKSTIAGVKPEDLEIYVQHDMLTIRGKRHVEEEGGAEYLYKECYWGGFSRSIILPVEVQSSSIEATLDDGILTVRLPKLEKTKLVNIKVHSSK